MRSVNIDSIIKKTRELVRQSERLIRKSEQLCSQADELQVTNVANRNNHRNSQKQTKYNSK